MSKRDGPDHRLDSNGEEPSSGPRLSRQIIVEAALACIDRDGTQGLSMRRLGEDLGVEAMSLYHYVTGREDLLEAVVDHLVAELPHSLDSELTKTWQGYLQTLAHAIRQLAVDHPGVFPLVATRHPAAPWIRPPLRSLKLVVNFLETLSSHGFTDEQVVRTYRSFSSFLLGTLLLEVAQSGAQVSPIDEPLDEGNAQLPNRDGHSEIDDDPIINRFRPLLSQDRSEEEFEVALEALLDRLELTLTQ